MPPRFPSQPKVGWFLKVQVESPALRQMQSALSSGVLRGFPELGG